MNKDLLKRNKLQIENLKAKLNFLQENSFQNQTQITDGFLFIISKYSKSWRVF